MKQLSRYDVACRALSEAKSVDDVREIIDKSQALREYARRAKNRQLEIDATEIRLRAERRYGQLLTEIKEAGRLATGGRPSTKPVNRDGPVFAMTLKDLDTTKNFSSKCQKVAAVPEAEFEGLLAGWRERMEQEAERVTTNLLRAAARRGRPEDLTTPPLPDGIYRVIYVDPPWEYRDAGVITESDSYGRAARHYPTMSLDDICALEVEKMAAQDSVLFLWVTSPMLEEAFKVIRAWGFKYKASFVWNKQAHNFGHYNSVRHEFLLLATRGSCVPDSQKLIPSIVEVPRGKHSEKPERFREIIDELYIPPGEGSDRIELFARGEVQGHWTAWGNQP